MGRYRRRKNNNAKSILILIGVFFIFYILVEIVNMIQENLWILYAFVGILTLVAGIKIYYVIYNNKMYKQTEYYKETQLPLSALKKPGVQFESTVFNALKNKYPKSEFILNGLFRKKDSLNELFEVDLLMFSNKGIFCLEIKDWNGMVYGDLNAKKWTVGYGENDQEKVIKAHNPVIQNKNHIIQLNKHYAFEYTNYIIFSSRGRIGDGYDTVGYLQDFIKYHDSLPISLESELIGEGYATLSKEVDRRSHKSQEHIERLNYNKSYYK